jgi:hypothetical protein
VLPNPGKHILALQTKIIPFLKIAMAIAHYMKVSHYFQLVKRVIIMATVTKSQHISLALS